MSLPVVLLCLFFGGLAYGENRVVVPDAEALQTRLEALAEQPFIGGAAATDPAFMWRLYERREFNPAWNSTAKINALLDVELEFAVRRFQQRRGIAADGRDARLLAALDASFSFTPPTGYQDSLVTVVLP